MYFVHLLIPRIFFLTLTFRSCLFVSDIEKHANWHYLPEQNCGYGAFTDRIIGGKEASLGQFPWIGRIGYQIKELELSYVCAGSLINRWFLVTANHCFYDILGRTIKVVSLGENILSTNPDCENEVCAPPVQNIAIEYIVRFEDIKESPVTYADIGLIKLVKPVTFNDFVYPICLPRGELISRIHEYLPKGSTVEVAGWGTTNPEKSRIPDRLMYLTMPVVSLSTCKKNFPQNKIDDSQICIGTGKGKDTCVGDSGGPIMKAIALNSPPRYFLVGIVSYGLKWCGLGAAVYTNVTYYLSWILNNIEPID